MKIKISVPASSANLGPGFDIWGLSLNLRNEFLVQPMPNSREHHLKINVGNLFTKTSVSTSTLNASNPNQNLFFKSYNSLFLKAGLDPVSITMECHLEIPLSRGLGSSSTAIVGGLLAANEVLRKTHGRPFTMEEIYQTAVELEGHPDNVAPALFGGLILNVKDEQTQKYHHVKLPVNAPVCIAGIVPHITLATKEAREVVPQSNPLSVTSFQAARTALMSHLLSKTDWSNEDTFLFGLAIEDKVHQQMRSALIPGMTKTFSLWKEQGALGCFLSGSGSTLLAFWHKNQSLKDVDFKAALLANGIDSTAIQPEMDNLGATIEVIG